MKCWHCDRELCWQSDIDVIDYDMELQCDMPYVVTYLTCHHCKCEVQVKYPMPYEYMCTNDEYSSDEEATKNDDE
jgi:hypothetical protein